MPLKIAASLARSSAEPTGARLLVSVRNGEEATEAIAGGAQILDVKEPRNGPLGPASLDTVSQILQCADGRLPVTAAAGELRSRSWELFEQRLGQPAPELLKLGLAGCGTPGADWQERLAEVCNAYERPQAIVPVSYADYRAASAPPPLEVLNAAAQIGLDWFMVDTFDKRAGSLLDVLSCRKLDHLVATAHQAGLGVALAGRLDRNSAAVAASLGADIVGVRGAACRGGRLSPLSRHAVSRLRETLRSHPKRKSVAYSDRSDEKT